MARKKTKTRRKVKPPKRSLGSVIINKTRPGHHVVKVKVGGKDYVSPELPSDMMTAWSTSAPLACAKPRK